MRMDHTFTSVEVWPVYSVGLKQKAKTYVHVEKIPSLKSVCTQTRVIMYI